MLVLGAGGAARAAVFGLRERGAEVFLLNRTLARAEALAHEAGAHVQPRETLAATHFDILINSTPYGMRGKTDRSHPSQPGRDELQACSSTWSTTPSKRRWCASHASAASR